MRPFFIFGILLFAAAVFEGKTPNFWVILLMIFMTVVIEGALSLWLIFS